MTTAKGKTPKQVVKAGPAQTAAEKAGAEKAAAEKAAAEKAAAEKADAEKAAARERAATQVAEARSRAVPPAEGMTRVIVTGPQKGRFRIGRRFGPDASLPFDVNADELAALESDPRLKVKRQ